MIVSKDAVDRELRSTEEKGVHGSKACGRGEPGQQGRGSELMSAQRGQS